MSARRDATPQEFQRWLRIKVAVWAYAYEVADHPLVSDADFDTGCSLVDVSVDTGNAIMDAFFREHFTPHTGQWIHKHPDIRGLRRVYSILQGASDPAVATVFRLRYPEDTVTDSRDLPMAKPFKFVTSHSACSQFENCPKQFYHIRVIKDFVDAMGAAAEWGNAVHKAIELYGRDGTPLPGNMAHYKDAVDALLSSMSRFESVQFERKLAMNFNGEGCDFFASDCFHRGVIDVLGVDEKKGIAAVVDWKLGKREQNADQADTNAGLIFANFPQVNLVRTIFVYMALDNKTKVNTYTRAQFDQLMQRTSRVYDQVSAAVESGNWPAKPSGLCRQYCAVTSCPHNGRKGASLP